jgi:hypothetical protein
LLEVGKINHRAATPTSPTSLACGAPAGVRVSRRVGVAQAGRVDSYPSTPLPGAGYAAACSQ